MIKPCAVLPVYNHEYTVRYVVKALLRHRLPCIVVDDGSCHSCAQTLDEIAADWPTAVTLLRHASNQGKGAAIMTGITYADRHQYTHALQIDADHQHCLDDIAVFLEHARQHPDSLILGCPIYDKNSPSHRRYGRQFTNLWVWINSLSFQIKDAMCGFRIYPVRPTASVCQHYAIHPRMSFDIEIAVRLLWEGVDIINVPTAVTYPENGISHFRMWEDNLDISKTHAQLFFGMLWRSPRLLVRKWKIR